MKIKAFLSSGRFKIICVTKFEDMKSVTANYPRWEYIGWFFIFSNFSCSIKEFLIVLFSSFILKVIINMQMNTKKAIK